MADVTLIKIDFGTYVNIVFGFYTQVLSIMVFHVYKCPWVVKKYMYFWILG